MTFRTESGAAGLGYPPGAYGADSDSAWSDRDSAPHDGQGSRTFTSGPFTGLTDRLLASVAEATEGVLPYGQRAYDRWVATGRMAVAAAAPGEQ